MLDHVGTVWTVGKWVTAGTVAGVTLVVGSAVTGEPSLAELQQYTPSLATSVMALLLALATVAVKAYVPSEKKVDSRFDVLESHHQTLTDRLVEFATAAKESTRETTAFRLELVKEIGGINANLRTISSRQERMEERLTGLERRREPNDRRTS